MRLRFHLIATLFLASAWSARAGETIYATLNGFNCQSSEAAAGAFTVLSFSLGGQNSGSATTATGAPAAGKFSASDVNIFKPLDNCTPKLYQTLAAGTHIASAHLVVQDDKDQQLLVIDLTDVVIRAVQFSDSADAGHISEQVSLSYSKIVIKHVPSGATGGWDLKTNKVA